MSLLKLAALDEEDLEIVSAHVQDAVLKVADLAWLPGEQRFALAMNRFAWEKRPRFFWQGHERRRSVLHFDRVLGARFTGFAPALGDEVLALLAIRFAPATAPAGIVELTFSGGAAVQLDVECIEARLADLGAVWSASGKPRHVT